MTPLVEKYRPMTLDAFAGLAGPRAMLSALARDPYPSAWLLLGPSGLGKTTMALAFAQAINGEVHHIASRTCDLETVDKVCHSCWFVPMNSGYHVVIVDESDQMSRAAQLCFLSKLDTTASPPRTIFMFTANETNLLEARFLSRCRTVKFSNDIALLEPAASLLKTIWAAEAPGRAEPDFEAMVRDNQFNVRSAVMTLEMELLAGGSFVPSVSGAIDGEIDVATSERERPYLSGDKAARPGCPVAGAKARPVRSPKPARVPIASVNVGDVVDAYAVAALLGINVATVYNRVKQGRLPAPNRQGRSMTWQRSEVCA